jgi:hypothetical protein
MRSPWRLPVVLIAAVTLVAAAMPAGAQEEHERAKSRNMENLFWQQNTTGATNSDLAFWGDFAYAGNYEGFRIFDISDPRNPTLVSDFPCFGPQNDVSVWDTSGDGDADTLFLSVDSVLTGPECGNRGAPDIRDPDGWEGIRIFDVSDPANPSQIGAVYQHCGSHTHTLYPDEARDRLLILNSSYPLRPGPTCGEPAAGQPPHHDRDPLHGVVQVIEVPMDDPAGAFALTELPITYTTDPDNMYDPCDHELCEPFFPLRACHDIAVFLPGMLVAGACAQEAQLWRLDPDTMLPDTENPLWVFDDPVDENGGTGDPRDPEVAVDFWHSATFSWDGEIVNFSDESFAGFVPNPVQTCPPVTRIRDRETGERTPSDTGRTHFFRVSDGKRFSHFMINRPEPEAYCSTHQGNVVLTPDRHLLVQAWYQGGVNVIDFTRPSNPREIAYFDFLPPGPMGSDNWSHYWYERDPQPGGFFTYASDGHAIHGRGFMVFETRTKVNRIGLDYLNPQTQEVMLP